MRTPPITPRPALKAITPDWPIYSILFLVLGSTFLPVELISGMNAYFLILSIFVWLSKKREFPKSLLVLIINFTAIITIGLISGIDNQIYPYLKDAWYFINPVLVISTGYCLGAQTPKLDKILRALIISGLILAIVHLLTFALNPRLLTLSATEIRTLAGNGNFLVGLSIAFLIAKFGDWRKSFSITPIVGWLILLASISSLVLSYSRTLVLVSLIFWLALRGNMVGQRFIRIVVIAIISIAILGVFASVMPKETEMEKKTFSGKLLRSVQELTISDYLDEQSINDNFRGFETARALKSYTDGGPYSWLGGRGFGHFVDLGVTLALGEGPMRYIPVLHNGIIYVLVKTGAIGLVLYISTFIWLFRRGGSSAISNNEIEKFSGRIVQGTIAICLLTSWLISGPFNKSALFSVLLLLGLTLAIIDKKTADI